MSKASTIKEALKRWEDRTKENCLEAKVIELQFQWLPIEKMDNTLSTLVNCEWVNFVVCSSKERKTENVNKKNWFAGD